jgi:hypothetical protein
MAALTFWATAFTTTLLPVESPERLAHAAMPAPLELPALVLPRGKSVEKIGVFCHFGTVSKQLTTIRPA